MKLVELSGKTQTDLKNITVRDLSNIDAAIWFVSMLAKRNPGLTWGDLLNKKFTMGGNSWGDLGNWLYEKGGGLIDGAGEKLGDAFRLITDDEVQEGLESYGETAARAYGAYVSGGASEMLPALFGGKGNQQAQQAGFNSLGQEVKRAFGGIDPLVLYMGGGFLLLITAMLIMKKK